MRLAATIALFASAGCDQLFKLEHLDHVDAGIDAPIDALPPCENAAPFGPSCRTIQLPLTGDTYLSAQATNTPLGTSDAFRISSTEPALFKFAAADIQPDERIASLKLTLDPYVSQNAKTCSSDGIICELCPAPGLGAWALHWVIADWNQAEATWNHASPASPWVLPGAAGVPDDRSELVASGVSGASLVIVEATADQLLARSPECYRTATSLALLVTIDGSAYFDAFEPNDCVGAEAPPVLEVSLCR